MILDAPSSPAPQRPVQVNVALRPPRVEGLHRLMRIDVKMAKKIKPLIPDPALQILIVDDDPSVGSAMMLSLGTIGHVSTYCLTPTEALAQLRNRKVDVILTDYRMPEMTGIEFAQEAKKYNSVIPIILMTGYASSVRLMNTHHSGISIILEKPFNLADLKRALKDVTCH